MKKIGEYTVKGQIVSDNSAMTKITLFDGSFSTGYRIKSFRVSMKDRASTSSESTSAKLATDDTGNDNREWNWQLNTEIAWAHAFADTNGSSISETDTVIDPDNMIVEDLYIGAYSYADAEPVNYIITLEKYDITDWQGALAMVRNRSQA